MKAIGHHIIVKTDKNVDMKKGGIIVPNLQLPQASGVIISVGDNVNSNLKENEKVIFHMQGGQIIILPDDMNTEYRILKEDEIYATI